MRLGGVTIDTLGAIDIVRSITWVVEQQPMILTRFPITQNDSHTMDGMDYWHTKLDKYLDRAVLLTLDSPEGRQAIAEHFATSLGLLASVWRMYGPPASNAVGYQQNSTIVKVE